MPDRKPLERLATDYSALRGLFMLPMSALLIVSALSNESWGIFAGSAAFLIAVVLAGAAAWGIDQYYRRRFGRVRLSHAAKMRALRVAAVTVPAFVLVQLVLRSRASFSLDLPVNATAIAFALLLAATYLSTVGLRTDQSIVLGVLFIAGALPVWTGGDPSNAGLVLTAAAFACLGILDHRQLVHQFSPPSPTAPHAGAAR